MEYLILSLASISLGSVVVVTADYHPVGSQFESGREHSIITFALRWGVGGVKGGGVQKRVRLKCKRMPAGVRELF